MWPQVSRGMRAQPFGRIYDGLMCSWWQPVRDCCQVLLSPVLTGSESGAQGDHTDTRSLHTLCWKFGSVLETTEWRQLKVTISHFCFLLAAFYTIVSVCQIFPSSNLLLVMNVIIIKATIKATLRKMITAALQIDLMCFFNIFQSPLASKPSALLPMFLHIGDYCQV